MRHAKLIRNKFPALLAACLPLSGCSLFQPQRAADTTPDQTVGQERNTARLDLSNKNMEKLPAYVFGLADLETLDASNNRLTGAIQAEIRQLKNLKSLDLSHNRLTGVPAEIGQLPLLESLDLSYNRLTGLPYELGNLKSLKRLDLTGNDVSETDLEIIRKALPGNAIITR